LKPYIDRRDYVEPETGSSSSSADNDPHTPSGSTNTDNEWTEADRLIGMKFMNKKRLYKVVWKDASHPPSWIPETDVSDCLKREYHINRTMMGKPRKRDTPQRFKKHPQSAVDGADN